MQEAQLLATRATGATQISHCLLSSLHILLDLCVSAQLQSTELFLFTTVSRICPGAALKGHLSKTCACLSGSEGAQYLANV